MKFVLKVILGTVLVFIVLLVLFGACSELLEDDLSGESTSITTEEPETPEPPESPEPESQPTQDDEAEPPPEPEPAPEEEPQEPQETVSQQEAREVAQEYIDLFDMSKKDLRDQMEFEGFLPEDIQYAVNNIKVNWRDEAARVAESYLELDSFSRQGLIDQLLFEGFTQGQAEYAVNSVGL